MAPSPAHAPRPVPGSAGRRDLIREVAIGRVTGTELSTPCRGLGTQVRVEGRIIQRDPNRLQKGFRNPDFVQQSELEAEVDRKLRIPASSGLHKIKRPASESRGNRSRRRASAIPSTSSIFIPSGLARTYCGRARARFSANHFRDSGSMPGVKPGSVRSISIASRMSFGMTTSSINAYCSAN